MFNYESKNWTSKSGTPYDNPIDTSHIPEGAKIEQEMDKERQLKAAFFALCAKALATLWYDIKIFFYILCPVLSPLFYNAYSSTFKLQGFNKSLKDFNIVIPTWIIISLVLISTIVYGFYSTLPVMQRSKQNNNDPSSQNASQISFKSLYEKIKSEFVNPHPLKVIAELLVLISTGFFIYTTGANAYDIFSGGSKATGLIIAGLCALGAAMGSLNVVYIRAPKAFPHIFNPYKWKTLYKNKGKSGVALIIQAVIQLPLLLVLSLGKMPWYLAIISSILTTILTYAVSVEGLCSSEIERCNNHGVTSENDNQPPNPIDEQYNRTAWTDCRFIMAAILYFIYCAITGVGAGFGVKLILSDQSEELSKHIHFHLKPVVVWTFAAFATVFALIGRWYFSGYKKTIVNMMNTMSAIRNSTDKWKMLSFVVISTVAGGVMGYYLQRSIIENALITASLSITLVCLILFYKSTAQPTQLQEASPEGATMIKMQIINA